MSVYRPGAWRVGWDTDGDITLELSVVDRMPPFRSEFAVQPFLRTWDRFADVNGWIKKHEAENRQWIDWTTPLAVVRARRTFRRIQFDLEGFKYGGNDAVIR